MSGSGWATRATGIMGMIELTPCWWCNRAMPGSYDRYARFACHSCQQIQAAEVQATRRHAEAQAQANRRHATAEAEAGRLLAVEAEVAERAAMWGLDA